MIRTDKRLRVCRVLLVLILTFIWGNSLLPGEVSGALSDQVKALLETLLPGDSAGSSGSGLLRKAAHFTEFAALGMALGWLHGMLQKGRLRPIALGITAACIDETIQCFVPGRGPGIRDVAIDSCGVLAGMALLYLGHTYFEKRKRT